MEIGKDMKVILKIMGFGIVVVCLFMILSPNEQGWVYYTIGIMIGLIMGVFAERYKDPKKNWGLRSFCT